MNLPQVDYFLTLCQTMNFTEAAKLLYITQPALSKQIATMERELGVILFDRSNRNLILTPAGEYLRDSFSKIQSDYTAAVNMCRKIQSNRDNQITIGFMTGWNVVNFIPNMSQFLSGSCAETKISFQSLGVRELQRALSENVTDIVVLPTEIVANVSGVKFLELGQAHSRLFFSRTHPVARSKNFGFEDFRKETFYILPEEDRCSSIQSLLETCGEYHFTPVTEILPNLESMISCLQAGIGVALFDTLHKLSVNPSFRSIDLPHTISVCAAWKDGPRGQLLGKLAARLTLLEN